MWAPGGSYCPVMPGFRSGHRIGQIGDPVTRTSMAGFGCIASPAAPAARPPRSIAPTQLVNMAPARLIVSSSQVAKLNQTRCRSPRAGTDLDQFAKHTFCTRNSRNDRACVMSCAGASGGTSNNAPLAPQKTHLTEPADHSHGRRNQPKLQPPVAEFRQTSPRAPVAPPRNPMDSHPPPEVPSHPEPCRDAGSQRGGLSQCPKTSPT